MISIPLISIIAYFLALVRGVAFLYALPPLTTNAFPFQARIAIAGGLAYAGMPYLAHDQLPMDLFPLVEALVIQLAIGALLGFIVQLFVGAIEGAGGLIDQFSGVNLPPSIDPLSLDQTPLLAKLYDWIATILLFTSGGILLVARGFEHSFSAFGTNIPGHDLAQLPTMLESDIVSFFSASVEIAAPLIAVIFVAQIVLGLLAKAAPQANVFALGFPLQLLLILMGLALAVAVLPSDLSNLVTRAISQIW